MSETTSVAEINYPVILIGVLGSAAGARQTVIESSESLYLSDLISNLVAQINNNQFKDLVIDSSTGSPLPNVIILLNDQDCNLFQGLRTLLEPGTLVTIIPVAHGG